MLIFNRQVPGAAKGSYVTIFKILSLVNYETYRNESVVNPHVFKFKETNGQCHHNCQIGCNQSVETKLMLYFHFRMQYQLHKSDSEGKSSVSKHLHPQLRINYYFVEKYPHILCSNVPNVSVLFQEMTGQLKDTIIISAPKSCFLLVNSCFLLLILQWGPSNLNKGVSVKYRTLGNLKYSFIAQLRTNSQPVTCIHGNVYHWLKVSPTCHKAPL